MKKPEELDLPEQIEEIIRLRGAIKAFLHAIDLGYFGDYDCLHVGPSTERVESAFVVGLREVVGQAAGRDE